MTLSSVELSPEGILSYLFRADQHHRLDLIRGEHHILECEHIILFTRHKTEIQKSIFNHTGIKLKETLNKLWGPSGVGRSGCETIDI